MTLFLCFLYSSNSFKFKKIISVTHCIQYFQCQPSRFEGIFDSPLILRSMFVKDFKKH